ncbi:MAG: ABC transporter permease [Bacteroidota bacterium]|nr:ABC transporter permease [Bacteroidota bacterium]MDP4231475.1 ABC transporter permease [Bacteroidota bacterium]MDP4235510.1 ABC transporter permease [Bacteroidota bacterium]
MKFIGDTRESLSIALTAVRANPLRSTLTMLGIIIGIFTITLMGAFLNGMDHLFRQTASSMKTDVYYVDKWSWGGGDWRLMRNRPDIQEEYLNQLQAKMTTAASFSMSIGKWGQNVKYKNRSVQFVTADGVNEGYLQTESMNIQYGRFFTSAELLSARPVCVIGYEIASKLFPNTSPLGEVIRVSGYPLQVIGIAKRVGGLFSVFTIDNTVVMPYRTLQTAFGQKHQSVTIGVKAKSVEHKLDTKDELEFYMRQIRKLKPNDQLNFGINNQDQFNEQIDKISGLLSTVGFLITGLSLLVGGIGIMNIMYVSVKERTREIGIRKAIGATRRSLVFQFLYEATILALLAGAIALALAYPVTVLANNLLLSDSDLQIAFPIAYAGLGLGLAIATGIIFGLAPALRASRLDPVDALRYE